MEHDLDSRLHLILAIALLSIIIGGAADLMMDKPATWISFHVIFETLMIAGALVMATTLWLGWWRSAHSAVALRASLETQLTAWRLTPTEREVALMLLKGYGHKEIAALTGRSERTVRQHAGVVYEKAGIAGRAELAAYFLHDLMLPEEQRETLGAA
jgi:DNA-binding CsgD family transcriptional regulator